MLTVIAFVLLATVPAAQGKEHLRIGTVPLEPFTMMHETRSDDGEIKVMYHGFIPDLLNHLTVMLDFNYTLVVRDDQLFGHEVSGNRSWDGLIGDVIDDNIDLAAAPVTENAERREVVDFSTPFMTFGQVAILKKQETVFMSLTDRLERIFVPFSRGVWFTVGLGWLITSVVLYVVCHVNPYEWRRLCRDQQATMREGEMSTCPNVFWFTISTFLLQGFTRAPRSLGGRIITIFWWQYILLFIVIYMASMTNYLRVGPMQEDSSFTNFRTVSDLADQTEVKYGVLRNSATLENLQNSKNHKLQLLSNSISNFEETIQDGIQRVRTSAGPYAFITESSMAMFYAKQNPCDVYMVTDYVTSGSYALVMPLQSPRVQEIDVALLTLRENGVLGELTDKWFKGQCTSFLLESNQHEKFQIPPFYPVDMTTISGALIILIGGIVLGSLATVVEVLIFKQAEKDEKGEKERLRRSHDGAYDQDGNRAEEPITDV